MGKKNRKRLIYFLFATCLVISYLKIAEAQNIQETKTHSQSIIKPKMIYVSDFFLDVKPHQEEQQGPLRSLLHSRKLVSDDPKAQAGKMVEVLSEALVDELRKRGLNAMRTTSANDFLPEDWLLEGEFLDSDEGNSLRRASIGSKIKGAPMHVMAMVSQVDDEIKTPILVFDPSIAAGKKPGSILAAVIMKNPYVMAAKFVLSRKASDKEIKKLASEIASGIEQYMKERGIQ